MRFLPCLMACFLAALPAHALEAELVAEGLTSPVEIADPGDGSGRLFVAEQHGLVRVLEGGALADIPLLDLRSNLLELREDFEERGLLGFALHPDFTANGRVYVSYSAPLRAGAPAGWNHTRKVSELTLMPGEESISLGTERPLLTLDWPSRKHNGGGLTFGPDGYLFIGLGDGGGAHGVGPETIWSAFEVPESQRHWDRLAQDVTTLYGKVLRVDVDRGFPGYGIPPSNPFVGKPGRDEIFAWGLRNPYRLAVDRQTGAMLAPAVAETLWEAVYLIDGPSNFGWPVREGFHCVDRLAPREPPADCPRVDAQGYAMQDPVVEYPNMQVMHPDTRVEAEGLGTAVTGARIYRGSALAGMQGRMILSDWSADFQRPSGQIFTATPAAEFGAPWVLEKQAELPGRVVGLAEDAAGEILVLTNDNFGPFGETGKIYRLVE